MKRLFILFLPVLLQACSSMYIPSVKNTPLFEQKGEGQIEAGASTNSFYATGSYAVTDKYALAVNGSMSYRNFSNTYDIGTPHIDYFPEGEFSHRYIEASLGRYNLLPRPSTLKVEIFAGGGYGSADDIDIYKSRYYLGFIQGNGGVRWKIVELGGSIRMAYSAFDFTYDNKYVNDYLQKDFNAIHFEPLGFVRIGKGPLKVVLRGGINFAWTLTSLSDINFPRGIEDKKWQHTTFHFSVGVSYQF